MAQPTCMLARSQADGGVARYVISSNGAVVDTRRARQELPNSIRSPGWFRWRYIPSCPHSPYWVADPSQHLRKRPRDGRERTKIGLPQPRGCHLGRDRHQQKSSHRRGCRLALQARQSCVPCNAQARAASTQTTQPEQTEPSARRAQRKTQHLRAGRKASRVKQPIESRPFHRRSVCLGEVTLNTVWRTRAC